jgi:hypothetical protein
VQAVLDHRLLVFVLRLLELATGLHIAIARLVSGIGKEEDRKSGIGKEGDRKSGIEKEEDRKRRVPYSVALSFAILEGLVQLKSFEEELGSEQQNMIKEKKKGKNLRPLSVACRVRIVSSRLRTN